MKKRIAENAYFALIFIVIAICLTLTRSPRELRPSVVEKVTYKILYRSITGSYEEYLGQIARLNRELNEKGMVCHLNYLHFLNEEIFTPLSELEYLVGCAIEQDFTTPLAAAVSTDLGLKPREIELAKAIEFGIGPLIDNQLNVYAAAYNWSLKNNLHFVSYPHFFLHLNKQAHTTRIVFPILQQIKDHSSVKPNS